MLTESSHVSVTEQQAQNTRINHSPLRSRNTSILRGAQSFLQKNPLNEAAGVT